MGLVTITVHRRRPCRMPGVAGGPGRGIWKITWKTLRTRLPGSAGSCRSCGSRALRPAKPDPGCHRAVPASTETSRPERTLWLTLIKAAHTLAWLSIESCMAYVLYAGAARRTDRRAALAGTVVASESLIFAINGFRCPLTPLAERLGAADGSVTDIWLPRWFAHNLPAIHVPLLAAAAYLNGRNLRERQRLHR